MSFLAQLRQKQQPTSPSSLQLCYIWRRGADGCVVLALYLATVDQGRIRELGKPYLIQRQHLRQPPPFLTASDVKILDCLVASSELWLAEYELGVFPAPVHDIVTLVISTQKSFFEGEGAWQKMALAGSYPAEPVWVVDSEGGQSLSWSCLDEAVLWLLAGYPYSFEFGSLIQGVGSTLPSLVTRVSGQVTIDPTLVESFLECAGEEWQSSGLPLPANIPIHLLKATVSPVIVCRSVAERDELVLGFRYSSDKICLQRFIHEDPELLCVWDGDQLLTIEYQREVECGFLDILSPFVRSFIDDGNGLWHLSCKKVWLEFLLKQRTALESLGFTFLLSSSFKQYYVAPTDWSVDLKRVDESQWQFSLSLDADGQSVDVFELLKQLQMFNRESQALEHEILLGGKILILPAALVDSLASELGDLLDFNQANDPLSLTQIHRLKKLKDHLPESTSWRGELALLNQSIDLHRSPIMLDSDCSGVKATLRPYQWLGVCWLQHLKQAGFNGLLADDMGLGKTLQTLAHLSLEKQENSTSSVVTKPSLIVVPTSLLSNWASEIKQFCPHLSFSILHGGQRHKQWSEVASKDIVITSYSLIVRDLELWREQPISWLILDEAQVIKNVKTKISQAVRTLTADHRLCLSGTPVENHLGELWSILDFLEPDVLGGQKQFQSYYQKPIEIDANERRFSQLLSRIDPFILRRTKTQVAKDLPPKTLVTKMVTLGDEQMSFYDKLKEVSWESLSEQMGDTENKGQKQILLLTALMKLRQACCDPLLLGDGVDAEGVGSAKTDFCLQMLEELVAEGRAVLVFSQFTSMLNILADRLSGINIDYLMLTGKTKNRGDLVDQFQQGKAPIFLISLKAGGVGLNLTRADTVIHFDPWWNSAAEEQASDRAHRIGQENPVFVYKLIAEGTVEEKISLMQERKSLLSQQVNKQAQLSGESFALKLEDLLTLFEKSR